MNPCSTDIFYSDCGGVSVPEPRHAGELLPLCSSPKRLQGGAQGLHCHSGLKTFLLFIMIVSDLKHVLLHLICFNFYSSLYLHQSPHRLIMELDNLKYYSWR